MTLRLYYNGVGSVRITDFSIEETPYMANRSLFYTILALVFVNIAICVAVYDRKKGIAPRRKYAFAGLLAVSLLASIPLLLGHCINGHDLEFHLTRIEGIKDGWLSGQFPVRINPDFFQGYGYANPIFYGEILLYFPAFLRLVGFDLTLSYNIYGILINVFTCFGCYYCLKRMLGQTAVAMTGAMLYTLAPYRLVDMYIRCAVGEYTAMLFLPFIIYGMYRIFTEDVDSPGYKWCMLPLVVGLSGIIHTHVLTGEMTGGMILLACGLMLFRTLCRKRLWALLKTVLITIGVNAWFLVPFVDFTLTQDVRVFQSPSTELIQKTGLFLPQLFWQFMHYEWEHMDASAGIAHEIPLTLGGALALGLSLCAVMIWVVGRQDGAEQNNRKKQAAVVLILGVMAVWMSTVYFPWDTLSTRFPRLAGLVASVQFSWRFLTLGTVLAVTAACYGLLLLWHKEGKQVFMAAALSLCLLSGISGMYFVQECIREQKAVEIQDLEGLDTIVAATGGEYLLRSMAWYTYTEELMPEAAPGVEIKAYDKQGTNVEMTVESGDVQGYVLLPLMNYKGYRVVSQDGSIGMDELVMDESGRVRVNIPADYSGTFRVSYRGCFYWRLSEIFSLVCMIVLAAAVLKDKNIKIIKKRKGNEKDID